MEITQRDLNRKLILCSRDDPSSHKTIFRHLEECKTSASTLYVLYGAALRSGDYTLGMSGERSIPSISNRTQGKYVLGP